MAVGGAGEAKDGCGGRSKFQSVIIFFFWLDIYHHVQGPQWVGGQSFGFPPMYDYGGSFVGGMQVHQHEQL